MAIRAENKRSLEILNKVSSILGSPTGPTADNPQSQKILKLVDAILGPVLGSIGQAISKLTTAKTPAKK